jgi:hypothetical protein
VLCNNKFVVLVKHLHDVIIHLTRIHLTVLTVGRAMGHVCLVKKKKKPG